MGGIVVITVLDEEVLVPLGVGHMNWTDKNCHKPQDIVTLSNIKSCTNYSHDMDIRSDVNFIIEYTYN